MRNRNAFTLLELLVVIAIIAILLGLLLSAIQNVRSAAARVQCQNKVKQLALALHQYHDSNSALPAGHRSLLNREFMPYSGWTLTILPYLEQQALFDRARPAYRQSPAPFVNPPHTNLDTVVPAFICPTDGRIVSAQTSLVSQTHVAFTSYLGVAGQAAYDRRDGLLYQDSRLNLLSASDGTSNTLLIGERPPSADFQFGWWYAGIGQQLTGSADIVIGVREPNLLPIVSGGACGPGRYPFRAAKGFNDPCGMFHFWSPHSGGANFAFADGSVKFLAYSANPIMPALATRAGGEVVELP